MDIRRWSQTHHSSFDSTFSGIQTQIVSVEGESVDHLTTATGHYLPKHCSDYQSKVNGKATESTKNV